MAFSKYSTASFARLCILLLFLSFTTTALAQKKLSTKFYRRTCPDLRSTVKSIVQDVVASEPRMGASLLRLHFHDCFVNGCDGSVLLDILGGEKESVHNANSLRGFEVIDAIKEQVENICPGIVSCADILALVARESVVALGGPSWPVVFGRRDSRRQASANSANGQLPFATDDLPNLVSLFSSKGFSLRELVALSGAHTIGQARCIRFRDRIYGEQNIAAAFAQSLQQICPINFGDDNLGPLDTISPTSFNNDYYVDLTNFEGLLHSDQVLYDGGSSRSNRLVRSYARNQGLFFDDFSAAMFKMSKLGVLTGRRGMVRTNCRVAS